MFWLFRSFMVCMKGGRLMLVFWLSCMECVFRFILVKNCCRRLKFLFVLVIIRCGW